ncbi:MAG: Nif3-like dinuclear metal center hexameric protein [Clostridia bacterium]|nr:Nif3-like dinuclear metal center hexameric protein [Clostridia bacterium]
MQLTVNDILVKLQEIAPFENAEPYDNVGLIIGHGNNPVTKVLVALDATEEVVDEAIEMNAELIITHHPLFFHARKNLVEDDPEARIVCKMIRNHLNLISAHTNLDKSEFSGSMACARLLGLQNIRQEGLLFVGELAENKTAELLFDEIKEKIDENARAFGNMEKNILTVAVCGGAYDEGWTQAKALGAHAYLTGEVRHHNAIAAVMEDMVMFDAGHFGTEVTLIPALVCYLQKWLNDVEYNVIVNSSNKNPYGRLG